MVNIVLVKKVICKIVCCIDVNKVCCLCVCFFFCKVEEVIVFGDVKFVQEVFCVVQFELMCVVGCGVVYVNMVLCKVLCLVSCVKVFLV